MSNHRTLFEKIWYNHLIENREDGTCLIYIDRHLVHEVTSPQAFQELRTTGRKVQRPRQTIAVADHNVPTLNRSAGIQDMESRLQIETLAKNCSDFDIEYLHMNDIRQGIVHVVGPEQGFILPGTTVVCGDSHTSTHGAFGALAFGIGTSEVEHVLATQTILQKPAKNMRVTVDGQLNPGITAKDVILAIIARLGTAGGTGHVIEYAGTVIQAFSMEERMTVCNMSIEAGARAGLIAPDDTTFSYLSGKPWAPKEAMWDQAVSQWRKLKTDETVLFDLEITFQSSELVPQVTWGTSPDDVVPITGRVPNPVHEISSSKRYAMNRALTYMGLVPDTPMTSIKVDRVFIGSCTNGRIEDLRSAAAVIRSRKVVPWVEAMVVPGSGLVKAQAESEGLDKLFITSGFSWREPGCSMCLAMNGDSLASGQRCASTSNRNFEGRQGYGGRTHLMSPPMAAAAAITGYLTDVRSLLSS